MMPVSYDFYREVYLGDCVPQAEFSACAMRAAQQIFCDTSGKSATALLAEDAGSESVRLAICAVAEIVYRAKNLVRTGIVKETVGSWSKTYASQTQAAVKTEISAAEVLYLGHTGMLYKGRC